MKQTDLIVSKFPKGSEWRRWDLHVHTPESKLGSSFTGVSWDEYIKALDNAAREHKISVVGITDYMTIDGYEKVFATWKDDSTTFLKSIDLLLPNIELRSLPSTSSGKALNIHLIVDPTDPNHIQKIKNALRQLQVSYDGQKYGCIREELISFAQAQKPHLDNEAAYKFGIEQFKPSYDEIKKWLKENKWLSSNSLFAIANGKDGISGLPSDGFGATRDELLKTSDLIFSGNPKDREYYLGAQTGTPASEIKRMYKSLKPCIHGSDAHSIASLFKPDHDRRCWIKADPTFEGLKQILWEPETRVHIGPTLPLPLDTSKIIESITFANTNGWFGQSEIELNSGLVAIIGEKGSGKTAVSDLIAFAAGIPANKNSTSSFITKGRLHLSNLETELRWGGQTKSQGVLINNPYPVQRPLVRYLSQDFVERLCSDNHDGNELQQAIEEVVFSKLDDNQQEQFSSFSELRKAREHASENEKNQIRGELAAINREIEKLYNSLAERKDKKTKLEQEKVSLTALKSQIPQASNELDKGILQQLDSAQASKKKIEEKLSALAKERRGYEDFSKGYLRIKERLANDLVELFELTGVVFDENLQSKVKPNWDTSVEQTLTEKVKECESAILALTGNTGVNNKDDTLLLINEKIKNLRDQMTSDEANKRRLVDMQTQVSKQEKLIERLEKEIDYLDTKTSKELEKKSKARINLYLRYYDALTSEIAGLHDLYAPMKEQLSSLTLEINFELTAGLNVDIVSWIEKSGRFFDGRKNQSTVTKDKVEKFIIEELNVALKSEERSQVEIAIEKFERLFDLKDFLRTCAPPSVTLVELFDWIFSLDHVQTSYKILYGGTSLEHLSPGTRGIALLVLYLLMDDDDRRPLLIDQPEGNLDNSSIYRQLVPYIRSAKKNRQIILVTHNPNLVVSTDADQIIVATADRLIEQPYPRISYISGSLEHSPDQDSKFGIRQAVCTLLEGGDSAFKDREGRYSLKP